MMKKLEVSVVSVLVLCGFAALAAGAEPVRKQTDLLVGAIRYSPWLHGTGRAWDQISLTPPRWWHRLPYFATVTNDVSRLARTDAEAAEIVYRSEKDCVGLMVFAAFDDGARFDAARAVTFHASPDGREYRPFKVVSRRVVGTENWAKAVYFAYNRVSHEIPKGTRYLKVRIEQGGSAGSPQVQRVEYHVGGIETRVVDNLDDFDKVHSRTANTKLERAEPEKFTLVEGWEFDQKIMDEQILMAHRAGIDFWANLDPAFAPFSQAELYKLLDTSPHRDLIKFCVIIGWPNPKIESRESRVQRHVSYFLKSNYQKVLEGRPLVMVYRPQRWSDEDIALLRKRSVEAGAGNPYILGEKRAPGKAWLDGSFSYIQNYRPSKDGIPTVNFGINDAPRRDNPPAWGGGRMGGVIPDTKTIIRTLDSHVKWAEQNPKKNPARALLIYGWDEFAEGGWICPTWTPQGPNTERIDALHRYFYSDE